MIHIVADGSVDMPPGWEQDYDIRIIPIPIEIGGRVYQQGVDLGPEEFYRLIREGNSFPKTSLPSVGQFVEFYRHIAAPGDIILSLHVGSRLSGTYGAAVQAAESLAGYCQVLPFDSMCGSAALGFMCREARQLERAGASPQKILERLETVRPGIGIILIVDNLEFARRSGRIGALQAAMASMLGIKPIIALKDGQLEMVEKVRTRARSIRQAAELALKKAGDRWVHLAGVHSCDLQAARSLIEQIQSRCRCKETILTDLSISVAAHLGPGTVGVVVYPAAEPGR